MFHIRSNIEEQKSNIAVLTEIVKNMKVPEGILTHVLETHKDNYGKDYHYDVCEFLAEIIEVSDKGGVYISGINEKIMSYNNLLFLEICESKSLVNLSLAGLFNDQRNAEIAKNYSSFLASFCKKQSTIIPEKEDDLVFGNAYKIYLNLPQNENKSVEEEYKNSQDILSSHVNKTKDIYDYLAKDTYDYIAKKHEFILNNFSYLKEILVRYFERRESAENLIDSAYEPLFDISLSEDVVLDELNMLNKNLNHTNNVNYLTLKDSIIKIQEHAKCLELDSNNMNQAIKKILVTKLTGQLKNRLENLL